MTNFFKQFIIGKLRKTLIKSTPFTSYIARNRELRKRYANFVINIKSNSKSVILIGCGIISASFGFKGFLLTNKFIDGGATGISLLISNVTQIPLYILIICVNIPFIILAYSVIGKKFAFKTALAITGLAICLAVLEFPDVTKDNILVAIFGGFFLGAGIGLAVRGGAVIDGTEVLAIYLSRKISVTIGDVIIAINVIIFSAAAYFLNVQIAMYSLLTYLSASKTLDFFVEGLEEYNAVTIISKTRSGEIVQMIAEKMRRGVTVYKGKKGFGKNGKTEQAMDIIYTVITRLELSMLKTEIEKIDTDAFIVINRVKDIRGGMIKKRPLSH